MVCVVDILKISSTHYAYLLAIKLFKISFKSILNKLKLFGKNLQIAQLNLMCLYINGVYLLLEMKLKIAA